MVPPKKNLLTKILFSFVGILLLWNCNTKKRNNNPREGGSALDSIDAWILYGQNDSSALKTRQQFLEKAYKAVLRDANDSLKSHYLSEISLEFLKLNDSSRFRKSNQATMKWAEKTSDSGSLAAAHWDRALFFRKNSLEDSAFYHFSQAQKIYSALKNNFNSGRMLYNMALIQSDIKDYTGSEISTIKAIELLKPLNKYEQLYNCYNILGSISTALMEFDRALAYHNEALGYLKKVPKKNDLEQVTENNIGVVYKELGQHRKAIAQFKKVLGTKNIRTGNPGFYAKALDNLAYNRFKVSDTTGVETQFKTALAIRDSIYDQAGLAVSHYNLAEYYLFKEDTLAALGQAREAKSFAQESSNYKRLLQTLELLPRIDPENAVVYSQEYMSINDSLQREERQVRNKFERIRFETNEIIEKNQLLAKQKQLFLGVAIGSLLLGIAVLVIILQIIRNQRLKFKQRQQETDREIINLMLAQSGKLEEGKQLEQKRVSQELHDGILGQMLGIRLMLSGLNSKTDGEAIAQRSELIKKLREVEEEVRTISHELNDASYEKIHNFIHSIQDLINTFEESTGIKCRFDYDAQMDWDRLNGELKINIYRVVQESLQNSAKHADCKNLAITFKSSEGILHITIEDDGKGFDIKKGKTGIGLKNIDSRSKKMGGSWNIKSKVGVGTKLMVQFPLLTETGNTSTI